MDDETTPRILRVIQREIAEIREDRAMMIESLDRLEAALNSLSTEMRILRSQFDRLRNDVRSQHDREGLECTRGGDAAEG
jgi:chromosome segregation ATPase